MIINIEDFDNFEEYFKNTNCLLVSFIGYERRSIALLQTAAKIDRKRVFCWALESEDNRFSFTKNKAKATELGFQVENFGISKLALWIAEINQRASVGFHDTVAVDYSSLPRSVYTHFLRSVLKTEIEIPSSLWYVHGRYRKGDVFPCVGVGNWHLIEDRSRIDSEFRSTLVGLGYDWTRTYGILDKLNPQEVYCFGAALAPDDQVSTSIRNRNDAIISMSQNFVVYPATSFSTIYFGLRDFITHLLDEGDVEIIPDGPKPLIMAMTAAALTVDRAGLFCWHIHHAENARALDIEELSPLCASGFRLSSLEES